MSAIWRSSSSGLPDAEDEAVGAPDDLHLALVPELLGGALGGPVGADVPAASPSRISSRVRRAATGAVS